MINQKKSYCFRMLRTFLPLLLSFSMADETVYLLDLGVKINAQPEAMVKLTPGDQGNKQYALTKRHVSPKTVKAQLKQGVLTSPTFQDLSTLGYLEQYNLGNKYFSSGRYVEAIKLLEMVDFIQLSINQKEHLMKLHADALFNLGHYGRIVSILTENSSYSLNDELFFLLGMSSTKIGNKKIALHAFNQIIQKYPNSEYQNISKLQVRVLKR